MIAVIKQGHTLVPVHTGHGTPADHATVHALQARLVVTYTAGMRAAEDEVLAHEAERLETQLSTPVIVAMRQIVADEQALRAAKGATCNA